MTMGETGAREPGGKMCRGGCGMTKPMADFTLGKNICRPCDAAKSRKYQRDNRDKVAARKREYYRINREKVTARQRRYNEDNRDEVNARQRRYYQDNRDQVDAKNREYRRDNPLARAAHRAVDKARAAGDLVPPPQCFICGCGGLLAHHWSYLEQHRLDVLWPCRRCHRIIHVLGLGEVRVLSKAHMQRLNKHRESSPISRIREDDTETS